MVVAVVIQIYWFLAATCCLLPAGTSSLNLSTLYSLMYGYLSSVCSISLSCLRSQGPHNVLCCPGVRAVQWQHVMNPDIGSVIVRDYANTYSGILYFVQQLTAMPTSSSCSHRKISRNRFHLFICGPAWICGQKWGKSWATVPWAFLSVNKVKAIDWHVTLYRKF